MLTRAQGFALAFARVNVPTQRAELVKEIRRRVEPQGLEIIEIDLQTPVRDFLNDLLRRLAKVYLTKLKSEPGRLAVAESAPRFAIFVYGLEHSIPSSETYHPVLSVINYKRENFRQHLAAPLVIWLPEYALQAIIEGAPDFGAWRSGVFEFAAPQDDVGKTWLAIKPKSGQVELSRMTLEEKRKRIQLLSGLLAEYEGREDTDTPEIAAIRFDLLDRLGKLHSFLGDYSHALEFHQCALKIAAQLNRQVEVAGSLHHLGIIHQNRGENAAALTEHEEAKKIFENLGDRDGVAGSLHEIGIIHQARGEYDTALANYQKSLKIAEELGDRAGLASVLHEIGIIYFLRGKYDVALAEYEKSLKIEEELADRTGMVRTLNLIGIIHQERGDYHAALAKYEQALSIAEELGYRAGMAASLHQIGALHQTRGDYEAALAQYQKSLKIKEELGDRIGIAVSRHNIGAIHQASGDYTAALTEYEKSLKIKNEIGDRAGMAGSSGQIGKLFTETGRYSEAFEHLFFALTTFVELQSPNAKIAANMLKDLRAKWGAKNFDAAWQEKTGEAVPEWLVRDNVKDERTQTDK